jgi:hypothetical protein
VAAQGDSRSLTLRPAVLKNQLLVGTINANKRHWYKAAAAAGPVPSAQWLARLITRREPPENFAQALQRKSDDVKVVVQFAEA